MKIAFTYNFPQFPVGLMYILSDWPESGLGGGGFLLICLLRLVPRWRWAASFHCAYGSVGVYLAAKKGTYQVKMHLPVSLCLWLVFLVSMNSWQSSSGKSKLSTDTDTCSEYRTTVCTVLYSTYLKIGVCTFVCRSVPGTEYSTYLEYLPLEVRANCTYLSTWYCTCPTN